MTYPIISDDYAHVPVQAGDESATLYYGYEVTVGDEGNEEWCFRLKSRDLQVVIPYSDLAAKCERPCGLDMFDVTECLLAGVQECFRRGILRIGAQEPAP